MELFQQKRDDIHPMYTYNRIYSFIYYTCCTIINALQSRKVKLVKQQFPLLTPVRQIHWQTYMYVTRIHHCRSGSIREVLIFENFARRTNSRIQGSRENYFYNSATKEK